MPIKVAINGFGRIGRSAFKIAFANPALDVEAINDLTDTKTLAYLLKHDTNYGTYHHDVSFTKDTLVVDGKTIRVTAEKDPATLPWGTLGIDVVIESTGRFTNPEDAKKHLTAGAKRVVISAPTKGEGANTYVIGVNEDKITASDTIISNASCTTNCITPVAAIIAAQFGIDKAMMTTIHSYTASQALQDAPAKDLREGRNAAENIVPTTTGATTAAAKALPELAGIFSGLSIRVPTPVVSLSDFTFVTKKATTVEEINKAMTDASANPRFQGILSVTSEELVSSDLIGDSHSAIVDLNLTQVVGGNMVKIIAWYDNEWGYSNRLVEQVVLVGKTIVSAKSPESIVASPEVEVVIPKPVEVAVPVETPTLTTAPTPVPQPIELTPTPAPQTNSTTPTPIPTPTPTPNEPSTTPVIIPEPGSTQAPTNAVPKPPADEPAGSALI